MEQEELEQFINRHGRELYSFCRRLTGNAQEADDLYQDIFIKTLEMEGLPEDDECAKNLLLSAAVRLWKDRKRKFAWRRRIEQEKYIPRVLGDAGAEPSNIPEEQAIQNEKAAYIRHCVETLPEKLRLVVLLYYMESRKLGEIAEVLHIPEGTVKSRLRQAKRLLSEKLKAYHDEEVM